MPAHDSVLASTFLTALLLGLGESGAIAQAMKSSTLISQSSPFQSSAQPVTHPYSSSVELGTDIANRADYTLIHVNPTLGHNTIGDGSQSRPFQTITQALRSAEPNSIVLLAPGVYSIATGESFPLLLKPGVTVQGNPNRGDRPVLIQGGGFFQSASALERRNATILAADRAGLANVIVTNPTPGGHGLWIEAGSPIILESSFVGSRNAGIFIAGSGAPIIRGNYFNQNRLAGLMINGFSQAEVRGNLFEATSVGIIVAEAATPRIIDNRIVHNQDGLVIYGDARPELEANRISQNRRNSLVEFGASVAASTIDATGDQPAEETASVMVLSLADQDAASRPPQETQPEPAAESAEDSPSRLNETPPREEGAATDELVVAVDVSQAEVAAIASAPSPESPEPPEITLDIPIPTAEEISTPNQAAADLPSVALPAQILPSTSSQVASTAEDSFPTLDQAALIEEAEAAGNWADSPRFSTLLTRLGVTNLIATRTSEPTPPELAPSEAIEIPVISPLTNQVDPNSLAIGSATSGLESTTDAAVAIEIPVIAPPVLDPELSHLPELPGNTAVVPAAPDRLQAPSSDIPIGGIEGLPTISVPTEATGRPEDLPAPPSRAASLGLYYRVIVPAEDKATQEQVRSLVPDAFRTNFDGQIVMQAGAYEDPGAADELANMLIRKGLEAVVEFIR